MENKIDLVPLLLRLTVKQEVQIRKWAMPYDRHCERGTQGRGCKSTKEALLS